MQTVQFIGRATAFRPFGTADVHLGKNTFVEYRYATSVPNMRHAKGFESAPLDLSETGPRVSLTDSAQTIERAHHNEISISRREGKNLMQAAYYRDRVANSVITGVGDGVLPSADVLPDIYGNTFNYNGGELDTGGVRFVYQRKITDEINATVDYAFGGVLALGEGDVKWDDARPSMHTINRHAIAAKLSGTVPGSHTRWITSYRWTSGDALTPVDLFNVSAGQADPFLNVLSASRCRAGILSPPVLKHSWTCATCWRKDIVRWLGATARRCTWCSRRVRSAADLHTRSSAVVDL